MTLTKEQIEHYLWTDGLGCPFCRATDVEGELTEIIDLQAIQSVHCNLCGKSWQATYTLTALQEIEQ
jgi:transcription elongation factor Elf1